MVGGPRAGLDKQTGARADETQQVKTTVSGHLGRATWRMQPLLAPAHSGTESPSSPVVGVSVSDGVRSSGGVADHGGGVVSRWTGGGGRGRFVCSSHGDKTMSKTECADSETSAPVWNARTRRVSHRPSRMRKCSIESDEHEGYTTQEK